MGTRAILPMTKGAFVVNTQAILAARKTAIKLIRPPTATGSFTTIDPILYSLLVRASPHKSEKKIVKILRTALLKAQQKELKNTKFQIQEDKVGNLIIKLWNNSRDEIKTMFSCHMDTVHREEGLIQLYMTDDNKYPGYVFAFTENPNYNNHNPKNSKIKTVYLTKSPVNVKYIDSILGADDKIGVYIMYKMLLQKIPGLYVFHVGEERGCVGSTHIANTNEKLLKGIQHCIAFDRKGYGDVIGSQGGQPCCSSEFGEALASSLNDQLKTPKQKYKAGIHGSWTDSAVYTNIIPECTNLSVGYFNQHSSTEHFDVIWLEKILLPALYKVNWTKLPTKRDPTQVVKRTEMYGQNYGHINRNYYPIIKIEWSNITATTPFDQIPYWSPFQGYKSECTDEGFIRVIEKFLKEQYHTIHSAKVIAEAFRDAAKQQPSTKKTTKEFWDVPRDIPRDDELIDKIYYRLALLDELINVLVGLCKKLKRTKKHLEIKQLIKNHLKETIHELYKFNVVCDMNLNFNKRLQGHLIHIGFIANHLNQTEFRDKTLAKIIRAVKKEAAIKRFKGK